MGQIERSSLIKIALAVEGVLFLVFLIWEQLRVPQPNPLFTFDAGRTVVRAAAAAAILLAVNLIIFEWLPGRIRAFEQCRLFKEEYIYPLARLLGGWDAMIVSAAAGIGEEFFFRGVLQPEIGVVLSGVIFVLMHFGPAVSRFPLIALIYFCVSLYFALLYSVSGDLWAAALGHGLYDFLALIFVRRQQRI